MKEQAIEYGTTQIALFEKETERSLTADREVILNFKKFNTDVDEDVKEIQDKIDALKVKLSQKQYDEESKAGYLRSDIDSYNKCLTLDTDGLRDLLKKDLEIW